MRMNRIETWMMNNPVRAAIQAWYAVPLLGRMGGSLDGARVLEPGCGNGVGTALLLDKLGAASVDAFDLDPEMVARARRRLGKRGERARVFVASVTEIPVADQSYDAVAIFGVLHHIPDWRQGLREIVRVLRPGGLLLAEESYASFICHPVWRRLLHHPQEDRFDAAGLVGELANQGLEVLESRAGWGGGFGWMVARRG